MAKTLSEWVEQAGRCQFPVLASSKRKLSELLDNEENIKVDDLVNMARLDPGFSIGLLREAGIRSKRRREITTLSHAILLLSIPATIDFFKRLPVLEQTVTPELAYKIKRLYFYQHLTGKLAMNWSMLRKESENNELFTAGVNHDFLYLVLYLTEFETAETLYHFSTSSLTMLEEKEQELLGNSVKELSKAISQHWHLPYLVRESYASQEHNPKLTGINLASELVQWLYVHKRYDYPDKLLERISAYMRSRDEKTHTLLNQTIISTFRHTHGKLPAGSSIRAFMSHPARLVEEKPEPKPTLSRKQQLVNCVMKLRETDAQSSPAEPINEAMRTLHDVLGFSRSAFYFMNAEEDCLYSPVTANNAESRQLGKVIISLDLNKLFRRLMQKETLVMIHEGNKHKYMSHIPPGLLSGRDNEPMLLNSITINDKPYGCFVICHGSNKQQFSEPELKAYKTIRHELKKALNQLQNSHTSRVA